MSKKYIALIIALLLLPAFLMTGCYDPAPSAHPWVTFAPEGGLVDPAYKQVTFGKPYGELPVPTRSGYTFIGWYTAEPNATEVTSSTKVADSIDHVLFARWKKGDVTSMVATVTFDPNYPGATVSPDSKEVAAGLPYGELPVPTKPDYTFIGWYTEKVGGTEVTSSTIVTRTYDHTLYAHWSGPITTKRVTVTFDPNYPGATVSPDSMKVTVGLPYGALPTPNPPSSVGLIFLGWYTEKTGGTKVTTSTIVTIDHDHTLYAHWK